MQVEIFGSHYTQHLQQDINKFIKGKKIKDIKYCINGHQCSALIIYEESENSEKHI